MNFISTDIKGLYLIELSPHIDDRGSFSRSFCSKKFEEKGLEFDMKQTNISISKKKFTLRGMHFQKNGFEEAKLVRCVKGKIIDTVIDLRPESETYCKHFSIELNDKELMLLYVPKFFAHGFITLEDNTEVNYQVSTFYSKENESGIRWNDPLFDIKWPTRNPIISTKDSKHPNYKI